MLKQLLIGAACLLSVTAISAQETGLYFDGSAMVNSPAQYPAQWVGSRTFTLDMVVKLEPFTESQTSIFYISGISMLANTYNLTTDPYSTYRLQVGSYGYTMHESGGLNQLTDGEYHHLAITYDSRDVRIYVDGQEVFKGYDPRRFSATYLSMKLGNGSRAMTGFVHDVRLWNTCKTAEQVGLLTQQSIDLEAPDLMFSFPLTGPQEQNITDETGTYTVYLGSNAQEDPYEPMTDVEYNAIHFPAPEFIPQHLYFDGEYDVLQMTAPASFDDLAAADFTLETSCKLKDNGITWLGLMNHIGGVRLTLYRMGNVFVPQLMLGGTSLTMDPADLPSGVNLVDDQWHHVAVVRSVGVLTFYVDRTACTTVSASQSVTRSNAKFYVGPSTSFAETFEGQVSDMRIWKRALAASELNNEQADASALVAWWKMDDCEGDVVLDHSGNGVDLAKGGLTQGESDPVCPNPCATPGQLAVNTITETSANLTWNGTSLYNKYRLRWTETEVEQWHYLDVEGASFVLEGLTLGTQYRWGVKAFCTADEVAAGNFQNNNVFVTEGAAPCLLPANFTFDGNDQGVVSFSWEGNAEHYNIRYLTPGVTSWKYITNITEQSVSFAYAADEIRIQVIGWCGAVGTKWVNLRTMVTESNKKGVTSIAQINSEGTSVYPNPSESRFTVSGAGIIDQIEVIDLTGQVVENHAPGTYEFTFGDDLESGVYLIRLTAGQAVSHHRVVRK